MTDQAVAYDFFSQKTRSNPQAVYEQLRNTDPVFRTVGPMSGSVFWVLTRYDDCITVLKDPRFGKEIRKHLPPEILAKYPEPPEPFKAIDRHLLSIDPPDHTRLRALVHKAFTPNIVENLRPRIQQIADDLIDAVQDKGEMDLLADFGFPLPIIVIAELLGIPAENRNQFRHWSHQLLFGNDDQNEVMTAAFEFVMYMHNMFDMRRAEPRDDLISALVSAQDGEQKLDQQELISMMFLLLVAGHETTVNLIGNGTLALLQHPDQMHKLQQDPGLIRSAVEEMLRYNGPVETTTFRWAFEDIPLGGKTIRTGDIVLAALLAANRDPAYFENPNTFDITREPNKHIAFGNGIHYCVGAPLARMEGAIAINTLLRRLPALHFAPGAEESIVWNDSILLHGMKALPVRF